MKKPFRALEELVGRIQSELSPDAEVQHDASLNGRYSGRKRQVDILITETIGQFEIKIIMECKDYNRPVDVKRVEEFHGLLNDVGAQKGVLVCPKGFTKSAKARAESYRIDLYSLIDTGAHKWQLRVIIPIICDLRWGEFMIRVSPYSPRQDLVASVIAYDNKGNGLGTPLEVVKRRLAGGEFPMSPGEHHVNVFDTREVLMDDGSGTRTYECIVSISIRSQLYFGKVQLDQMSAFKNELTDKIITNRIDLGELYTSQIEKHWLPIHDVSEAPETPVATLPFFTTAHWFG